MPEIPPPCLAARPVQPPFECPAAGCGKWLATQNALAIHRLLHNPARAYVCPQEGCLKRFVRQSDRQRHLRIHTGIRPYLCPFEGCGKRFSQHGNRAMHLRSHIGIKRWQCTLEGCSMRFLHKRNRDRHSLLHEKRRNLTCSATYDQTGPVAASVQNNQSRQPGRAVRCTMKGDKKRCSTPEDRPLYRGCPPGDTDYACDFAACRRTFRTQTHLERHLAGHSDTAVPVAPGQKTWQLESRILNPDGRLLTQWQRLPGPMPPRMPPAVPPAAIMARTAAQGQPTTPTQAPCLLQQRVTDSAANAHWMTDIPGYPEPMPTPAAEGPESWSFAPLSSTRTRAPWPACWPESLPDGSTLPPLPADLFYAQPPPVTEQTAGQLVQEPWCDTGFDPWLPPPIDDWPAARQDPGPDRAKDRLWW